MFLRTWRQRSFLMKMVHGHIGPLSMLIRLLHLFNKSGCVILPFDLLIITPSLL